jgi:hypothetical protein
MRCLTCEFDHHTGMRSCDRCRGAPNPHCGCCGMQHLIGLASCYRYGTPLTGASLPTPPPYELQGQSHAAHTPTHVAESVLPHQNPLEEQPKQSTVLLGSLNTPAGKPQNTPSTRELPMPSDLLQ